MPLASLSLIALLAGASDAPPRTASLSHGRFQHIAVYVPAGTPQSFALLLSGDRGWDRHADALAAQLVAAGAMVAGIDTAQFAAALAADGSACVFPDGDLENLSHFVQAYYHVPTYLTPLLVGDSAGGAFAYAILAQAPADTFGGALSVGFCPRLTMRKPLCKGTALGLRPLRPGAGMALLPAKSLADPWIVLQAAGERSCKAQPTRDFVAKVAGGVLVAAHRDLLPQVRIAFGQLIAKSPGGRLAPPPAALGDLPVVVIPAAAGSPASDRLAIMLSGDGGWAGLDQSVAAAIAASGIPVIGLDSLRYFWTARSPEGLAMDTDRLIRYYLALLGKRHALLIGYSQGADVLPFAVNRLPATTRASISLVAVMGLSEHALFEFHVTNWLADDTSGPATMPEVEHITGVPVICIYGADEADSLCPKLDPKRVRLVRMSGGHHFDDDYAGLARQILAADQ